MNKDSRVEVDKKSFCQKSYDILITILQLNLLPLLLLLKLFQWMIKLSQKFFQILLETLKESKSFIMFLYRYTVDLIKLFFKSIYKFFFSIFNFFKNTFLFIIKRIKNFKKDSIEIYYYSKNNYSILKSYLQQNYPMIKNQMLNFYNQIKYSILPSILNILKQNLNNFLYITIPSIKQNLFDFISNLLHYTKKNIKLTLKKIYFEFFKLISLILKLIFDEFPKFILKIFHSNVKFLKSFPSFFMKFLILLKEFTIESFIELFEILKKTPKFFNLMLNWLIKSIEEMIKLIPKLLDSLKEFVVNLLESLSFFSNKMLENLILNLKEIPEIVNNIFISIKRTIW